jgi:transmembrane sensor
MIMIGMGTSERQRVQIDSQARTWQLKIQRGCLQQDEMEEFGHWMAIPAHAAAYADCEWSTACIEALDQQPDAQWTAWKDEAVQRAKTGGPKVEPLANWSDLVFSPNSRSRNPEGSGFLKPAFAVAACLALVAFGFSWQRTNTTNVLHYQAGDATREVLLPDGTRLTLDAGTAVDYMKVGDTRRLLLPVGRVYLSVSKDPQRARFVVQSGEVETVVLGTRFQVSQTAERTEVVLEEGKVRMQRPGTALFTNLVPGQRGWWSADASSFHTAAATPSSALAWTRGRLLFENVSLADAIVEVNRYSKHVQIELVDPKVGQLKVNGSYLAGDAELVVAAWEATLPVHALHQGDRIKLGHK